MTNSPEPASDSQELRRALLVLAGKWKPAILCSLYDREHRFGELKEAIPGISRHMLSVQLRELERAGLVARIMLVEAPPHAGYAITDAGNALEPTIEVLLAWWRDHRRAAAEARNADADTPPEGMSSARP